MLGMVIIMGLGFSLGKSYLVYGTLCVGFGSTQLGLSLVVKVRVLVPLREVKVRIYKCTQRS